MARKPRRKSGSLSPRQQNSLVKRWQSHIAAGREAYTRADAAFGKLVEHFGPGEHTLADGRTLILVDNFREKDGTPKAKVFGTASVARYKGEVRGAA